MTQEEKAKRYDEAIEIAKKINNEQRAQPFNVMTKVFPELKESEGERIRKAIKKHFCEDRYISYYGIDKKDILAWLEKQDSKNHQKEIDDAYLRGVCDTKHELEKQGEQKPADMVEPKKLKKAKFKTGDRIIGIISGMQYYITEICDDYYCTESGCIIMFNAQDNFEIYEQKPADNRKLCDIVIEELSKYSGNEVYKAPWALDSTGVQYPLYFAELGVKWQKEQKPADKVEPKFHEGDMIIHKELGGDYIHNPHKIIQVDILDKKYRLEGGLVAHFGEQEDYELVEKKPAWSEEDERVRQDIENLIHFALRDGSAVSPAAATTKEDAISWMQSLKEKYSWKPTDAFIEKACAWLKENKDKYLYNTGEKSEYIPTCSDKMIDEFRKYMEGE